MNFRRSNIPEKVKNSKSQNSIVQNYKLQITMGYQISVRKNLSPVVKINKNKIEFYSERNLFKTAKYADENY